MKKLVFTLVLVLSSAAFAGGNESIWWASKDSIAVVQNTNEANFVEYLKNATVVGGGVIVIGPGGIPIGVNPTPPPGGNDGHWTNDLSKEAIEKLFGSVNKSNLDSTTPGGVETSGFFPSVSATPGGVDTWAEVLNPGGSDDGKVISALKYLAETETSVVVQVNHANAFMNLPDSYLSNQADVAEAIRESVKSGAWVNVK